MRNDVIEAFKEAGVGMIEWPGGCAAAGYNWNQLKSTTTDVGTDLYMELCQMLGIEPMIVGPGTAAAAANNLAWVTYINQNTSHTDWAIHNFKIGNEVWGCGGNQDEPTYETNYLANYDKLSAPVNGKKLNIVAGTGLIGNWDWFDTEVKNLAGKIDGVELHDYIYHPTDIPCVGFSDNNYYTVVNAANAGQIGPRIDRAVQTLDKYDPDKKIKIYVDEWGDWFEPFDKASDGWLQQNTVLDAMSSAETLHLFMQHADRFAMAGLAQGVNVIHSLLLTKDAALVKTPTFYVFKMFLPHERQMGTEYAQEREHHGRRQVLPGAVRRHERRRSGTREHQPLQRRLGEQPHNPDHAQWWQERVRPDDRTDPHGPGEGQLQRLRQDGNREYQIARYRRLLAFRQDVAGHATSEERRDGCSDAQGVDADSS